MLSLDSPFNPKNNPNSPFLWSHMHTVLHSTSPPGIHYFLGALGQIISRWLFDDGCEIIYSILSIQWCRRLLEKVKNNWGSSKTELLSVDLWGYLGGIWISVGLIGRISLHPRTMFLPLNPTNLSVCRSVGWSVCLLCFVKLFSFHFYLFFSPLSKSFIL